MIQYSEQTFFDFGRLVILKKQLPDITIVNCWLADFGVYLF